MLILKHFEMTDAQVQSAQHEKFLDEHQIFDEGKFDAKNCELRGNQEERR